MAVRLTARARLTVLYGALFVVSGTLLAVLIIMLTLTPTQRTGSDKPGAEVAGKEISSAEERQIAATKETARRELRDRLVAGSGIALVIAALVSTGLGYVMAGRVLRPVHAVSGAARRLSHQNLNERIPVSGPHDEMRELAETFNDLLSRLERSFEAQQRFAANAAHELRGPITTQRTLIEVAAASPRASGEVRRLASQLTGVLDRQQRLVDRLLALASSEHGIATVEQVRIDRLATAVLDEVASEIDSRRLTVRTMLAPSTVSGDPALLELLVGNLIRNAVQHNVIGGDLYVGTSPGVLTVQNSGEQLTERRLAELVEPFRRGRQDRVRGTSGVGLGLAIAEAAARAHRARLDLVPRPGGGLDATVRFQQDADGDGNGVVARPAQPSTAGS